jgi:predicted ATPase
MSSMDRIALTSASNATLSARIEEQTFRRHCVCQNLTWYARPVATRFVGRQRELQDVEEVMARGERLITLTGPGGVGKTRMALELARRDGRTLLFCDLSEARSLEAVLDVVSRALGIDLSKASGIGRIAIALEGRGAAFVVLDNCENVVEAVAQAAAEWHARAPQALFMVTSREPLRVRAEQLFPVPPLSLPAGAEDLLSSDAGALFDDCIRRRSPNYRLEAELAADVVRRVDGLPLAIELCAARVAQIGLKNVADRLGLDRLGLDLLSGGARDAAARQQTMRATVAWSWELLTAAERTVLEQCSVFRGGFTLEAVIEVLPDIEAHPTHVVALVDKSMLRTIQEPDGTVRFDMYDVIRAFAGERLEASGRVEAARLAHMTYFARATALGDVELPNLVLAHTTAVAARAANEACTLALTLAIGGAQERIDAKLARLDAALDVADGADPDLVLRVRIARGEARATLGRLDEAEDEFTVSLARAEERHDERAEASALCGLGLVAWLRGDLDRAAKALESSRHLARRGNHAAEEMLALRRAINLAVDAHRLDDAERDLEEARALARRIGDRPAEAIVVGTMSLLHHRAGRNEQARKDGLEALALFRAEGDSVRSASTLCNLGVIAQELARHEEAHEHFEAARELAHKQGDRRLLGFVAGCQGRLEHALGRPAVAVEHYTFALGHLAEIGDQRHGALFRAGLGASLAARGDERAAQRELAAAAAAVPDGDNHLHTTVDTYRAFVEGEQHPSDAQALAESDEDLRIALALFKLPAPADGLLVASDGAWFIAPGAPIVHLAKRRNLRRVLVALSKGRLAQPGRPLSVRDLIAAGWPGERILAEAASMRVYATVARLRKLGLVDYLVSRGDGYLLDAHVPLVIKDP